MNRRESRNTVGGGVVNTKKKTMRTRVPSECWTTRRHGDMGEGGNSDAEDGATWCHKPQNGHP